jgi:Kef-type K+ transport system membrane component KefB
MFDSLLVIIVAGLVGPGVGLLLVWIPLADVLTVLLMPLTLVGAAEIPSALAGDALIVAGTVVTLWFGERLGRSQIALTLRDGSKTRGWALQLRVTLLILVVLSVIATRTGGSTLLAAFGAGLVLDRLREPARLEVQLSGIAEGFFVPAFFVLAGCLTVLPAAIGTRRLADVLAAPSSGEVDHGAATDRAG